MPVDFFEKEVRSARERFNQTFGVIDVCDLKTRRSTILAIISLGLLVGKIKKAKHKDDVRDEIKRFMRTKTVLDSVFNQLQKDQGKRRNYADANLRDKAFSTG